MARRPDQLFGRTPSVNFTPKDEFWQEGVAIEAAPVFLGALDQLEHHGERRPVRFSGAERGSDNAWEISGKPAAIHIAAYTLFEKIEPLSQKPR